MTIDEASKIVKANMYDGVCYLPMSLLKKVRRVKNEDGVYITKFEFGSGKVQEITIYIDDKYVPIIMREEDGFVQTRLGKQFKKEKE